MPNPDTDYKALVETLTQHGSDWGRNAARAISTLLARAEAAERVRERLYRVAGMGGVQGEAPPELVLAADGVMGCDAWLYVRRINSAEPVMEYETPPVRFVRHDIHAAAEARVAELERALEVASGAVTPYLPPHA